MTVKGVFHRNLQDLLPWNKTIISNYSESISVIPRVGGESRVFDVPTIKLKLLDSRFRGNDGQRANWELKLQAIISCG